NAPDKPTHSSANKAPRPALPPTGPSDIQTAPPLADSRTLAGATPLAPIVVEEGTDTPASAVQAPSATATSPVPPPGQEESTSPPDHSGSS
ncbi:MAG: hypothetical protein NZ703_11270, partial [Gemmataceae bacterium]|nr:hypothetical protein [Gemmataceae bacterium]